MGLFNHGAGDDGAVLQHILQVHQVTVVHMLGIVVRIVEVDDARLVGVHNLLGQQNAAGNVLAHLACHIVPLDGVDGRILVGVLLLDFLIVALNQAENPVVGGVGFAHQAAGIAVSNILLGHLKGTVGHDGLFHQILNFLHGGAAPHLLAGNGHALGNAADLQGCHAHLFVHCIVGLLDGNGNFIDVEDGFRAVSFDNFHMEILQR